MLKVQRPTNRPSKQRERVDFKFSNFQALQVPKGWDRLFVSLISVETGKTIAKLGKALVKNGSCQWTETLSESFHISREDSAKGYEECLVKLLVSTGSTRSNTLGETIINVAQYTGSRLSAAVSQPLKKCSYGTILQVKIQRPTPRSKTGDEESKKSKSQEKDQNVDVDRLDLDSISYRSDNSGDSTGKTPQEDLATASRSEKLESKEGSESAFGIIHSFQSREGSIGRENSSVKNTLKSEEYDSPERQVGGSINGGLVPDHYSVDDDSPSNQPSENSRLYLREDIHIEMKPMMNVGSSRNLLDIAEDTIEELRAEAKMWERNARKLMIDLDISRSEFSNLSKKHAELRMEISAAYVEQDGLKREVERLKLTMDQVIREDPIIHSESLVRMQKELENEMKYQQYLNDDLGQHLKRSQESNVELVCVLQELEETIEQQRIEIESLTSLNFKFTDLENSMARDSEENRNLLLQLQQLVESEKKLQSDIELLEEALRDKSDELENERKSNREILSQVERDYKYNIFIKEEEIANLEATLSGYVKGEHFRRPDGNIESNHEDLIREIESLREKVQELEKDCTELTDENLELLFKLKDSNKTDIRKCSSFDSMTSEHPNVCHSDESVVSDPKFQISYLEEEVKKNAGFESSEDLSEILKQMDVAFNLLMKPWYGKSSDGSETCNDLLHGQTVANKTNTTASAEYILSSLQELNKLLVLRITESNESLRNHEIEIKNRNDIISDARKKMEDSFLEVQELEKSKAKSEENYAHLMKEFDQKRSEVDLMEDSLLSKEQEAKFLLQHQVELETKVSELQQEKSHLEQDMEVALRENKISSECLENLQNDLTALRNTVSSHVSAYTDLERTLQMLERERHESEHTRSGLQEENMQLQECISNLEAQLQQLRDEREMCLKETDHFKSVASSLQDDIQKLGVETSIQISNLKQKSEDVQQQWLRAEEKCEHLKEENKALQESKELENTNLELKTKNQELHEKCSALVDQLNESKKSLSDCSKRVELLEDHLTSVLEDFELRENSLKSDLDALIKENIYQKKKLSQEESFSQILLEKTAEFESLQKEVEHLSSKVSDAHKEREKISFEATSLLDEKAMLQALLQEVQLEAELKAQEFNDQIAASKQSHERLKGENERILKLLANYKKSEEKLKTDLNDLELKLTISDYEREQLTKETGILKIQLQNMSGLQDEISMLKSELKECRVDKGKREIALHAISGGYEELKAENYSLSEKMSIFEGVMSEFEECRRNKLYLEEKLLQMEKDLAAKEIFSIQNADLKNELMEMKRANIQFQQKMYRLEEDRDECLKKAQALEENLKSTEERNNIHNEGAHNHDLRQKDPLSLSVDSMTKGQFLEHEVAEEPDANNRNRILHERTSKKNNSTVGSMKSSVDGVVTRERYERTKSSLKTELKDLKDRYLEMSLKYAEVEAQREDLVMKLRATRGGKRWFLS